MNGEASGSEDNNSMSEGSDNEDDTNELQSVTDKKRYLLKMLEKQGGGTNTKQVFNFEEEDQPIAPVKVNGASNGQANENSDSKKKRGRPANKVHLEEDDEEMDEDDPEY
jgi:hypothetical protein